MARTTWAFVVALGAVGVAAGALLRDVTVAGRASEPSGSASNEALLARLDAIEARLHDPSDPSQAGPTLAGRASEAISARLDAIDARLRELSDRSRDRAAPDVPPGQPPKAPPAPPRVESAPAARPAVASAPASSAGNAWKTAEAWTKAYNDLKGPAPRQQALAEIERALSGREAEQALAALIAVQRLGRGTLSADEWRPRVQAWATSEEATTRRAALSAFQALGTRPEDVDLWIAELRGADRNGAEQDVFGLVAAAGGVVEGKVADAVFEVLADGRDVKRAFVMRGLQQFKSMDARLVDRLVEIVRSVETHDYDSAYFFHFLAPQFDPKPDAVVDVALETAAKPHTEVQSVFRCFQRGLSDRQKTRVVTGLLDLVEGGADSYVRVLALQTVAPLATRADVRRLDALAANPQADEATRRAAADASKQAAAR